MSELRQKTIKGLFWSYLDYFGVYFIKFGFTIAIARALSPSDYGIVGMIVIFIAIGNMLTESGFAMALIQNKNADENDFSTVFWFNVLSAIVIYTILYFFSEAIANFYNNSLLVNVTRISALGLVFSSLVVVQMTILAKELNFKKQAIINFVSAVVSGTTGIILAYFGNGVWALVFMTLAGSLIRTIAFWIFSRWKPRFVFSISSFKKLYKYGYKIFLQGISGVIFDKMYYPLIGKYFPAAQLGFYTQANRFYELFIRNTTIAYGRVTFTAFASLQEQKLRFSDNYTKTYNLLAFVVFPLSLFLIITAKPFVGFFLTEKWLPAVPLMEIFFIDGFFFPFLMLNQNIFNATGRSDISLKIDITKKVMTFLSIFLAFQFGIQALIIGQVVSSFIAFVIATLVIIKVQNITISKHFSEIIPIFSVTMICGMFNWFIVDKLFHSDGMLLLSKAILIPSLYLVISFQVNKKIMKEFTTILGYMLPVKIKSFIY